MLRKRGCQRRARSRHHLGGCFRHATHSNARARSHLHLQHVHAHVRSLWPSWPLALAGLPPALPLLHVLGAHDLPLGRFTLTANLEDTSCRAPPTHRSKCTRVNVKVSRMHRYPIEVFLSPHTGVPCAQPQRPCSSRAQHPCDHAAPAARSRPCETPWCSLRHLHSELGRYRLAGRAQDHRGEWQRLMATPLFHVFHVPDDLFHTFAPRGQKTLALFGSGFPEKLYLSNCVKSEDSTPVTAPRLPPNTKWRSDLRDSRRRHFCYSQLHSHSFSSNPERTSTVLRSTALPSSPREL